jgi:hypothetical protein
VVKNTFCKPGLYKFATPIRAVANIPAGTAKLRRGPQRGLELRMETRLLRTESRKHKEREREKDKEISRERKKDEERQSVLTGKKVCP